jgi:flavin reductase (DIM6/NTAB) family NADH-FMN oxidoreductase RutF
MKKNIDMNAMMKMSYGLYVLGVKTDSGFGGQIIDSVAQVSMAERPNVILASMLKNYSNEMMNKYGEATLSVLGVDFDPFVIGNFGFRSGREADKWATVPHTIADGLPVLDGAIAHLRLKILNKTDLATHSLFLTETTDAWLGKSSADPLVYADYMKNHKDAAMEAFKKFQGQ